VNKNGTAGVLETKIEVMYSRTKAAFIVFIFSYTFKINVHVEWKVDKKKIKNGVYKRQREASKYTEKICLPNSLSLLSGSTDEPVFL
jgi:hypothetical protein